MFKVCHLNLAIRPALRGLALVTLLSSAPAWATVGIPEALSSGQQLGADSENQTAGNLAQMQGNVSTTTGATAGGTNSTIGISNTQAVGNPANGEDAESGATATGTYNFTINCNSNNQQNPIFPGDYGLFAANCTYNGSGASAAVSGMSLYSCPASINGGNCAVGSSNWQSVGIGPGQTVQIAQGVNVALNSCPSNDSGSCSGTVTVSNSTMHTSANLNNDATNEVVGGGSGVDTTLGNTYNSGNYQTAIQTDNSSFQLNSCTQQIKGGLNGNGIVYTCNGQQNADFNATNCTSTEQCVRWATQTESYTESCNQDIPLTENVCTTNTPTYNCTITDQQVSEGCAIYNTASVVGSPGVPTSSTTYINVFGAGAGPITASTNGSNNSITLTGSVVWACYGGSCSSCSIGSITLAPGQCAVNNCSNGGCGGNAQFCYTSLSGGTATYTAAMANFYRGSCSGYSNSGSGSVSVISSTETIQYSYGNPNDCSVYQQS